jgi:DNA-binding NarL/FixJ family response regulator
MTKILLVDDHAIVREDFKRLTARDGTLRAAVRSPAAVRKQTAPPKRGRRCAISPGV